MLYYDIQNDRRIRILALLARKSSHLEISMANIDDSGEYSCIVSNDAGSVMHSFSVVMISSKFAWLIVCIDSHL